MKDARITQTADCRPIGLPPCEQGWTSAGVLPFSVHRVYYMHSAGPEVIRGDHAHRDLMQLLVAVQGSFEVCLKDGRNERVVQLNRPDAGLIIHAGVWKDLRVFSADAVCLVLASDLFSEDDYIRSWNEFLAFKQFKSQA